MIKLREKIEIIGLILLTLVFPIAVICSFVNMPLTDDVKVFIGAAYQSEMNNLPFLHGIDAAWELKPIGNRILWRVISTAADWVNSTANINTGVQFVSILIAIWASILLAGAVSKHISGNRDFIFLALFLALITPFNLCLMQAEWWAVLLSYAALWLLLKETPTSMALAGILTIFIASLKLSTVLLIPTIFVAYLMIAGYEYRNVVRQSLPYLLGVISGGLVGVWWALYLPNVIPDALFSMSVAHTSRGASFSLVDGIGYLINYAYMQVPSIPILLVGIACGGGLVLICTMIWINAEDKKEPTIHMMLLGLLWIMPLASIFIQGEFFAYHYTVLIFPSVVSLLLLANVISEEHLRTILFVVVFVLVGLLWILHCSIWSPNYPAQQAFWDKIDSDAKILEEKYDLSNQSSLLFMTNANAPYWFRSPSACRQIGSLPIIYNMTDTKEYYETEECIQKYRGEFVIAVHDTGSTIPPVSGAEISRQMPERYLKNYTKIETMSNWEIYRRVSS